MTDEEHARAIKAAVTALNNAVEAAACVGVVAEFTTLSRGTMNGVRVERVDVEVRKQL